MVGMAPACEQKARGFGRFIKQCPKRSLDPKRIPLARKFQSVRSASFDAGQASF